MLDLDFLRQHIPQLGEELGGEIVSHGKLLDIPAGTEILHEGQHVKVVPIVVTGTIRVSVRFDDRELLLYYIQSRESCIMSFLSGLRGQPSSIFAVTENDTKAIALPAQKLEEWMNRYPKLNFLFFNLYHSRYNELVDTLQQLVFQSLDERLYRYFQAKAKLLQTQSLDLRHREIAQDLATSREVVTRVIRKLEKEGKVRQAEGRIHLL